MSWLVCVGVYPFVKRSSVYTLEEISSSASDFLTEMGDRYTSSRSKRLLVSLNS